jgi:TetR/AcrR family transcriptional repressor of nem operon
MPTVPPLPLLPSATTECRILDIAQRLVQTRGFNAFSYGDIAAELGVKRAAIHYHFASKEILGKELLSRYRTVFMARLEDIARGDDAARKLNDYAKLYVDVLKHDDRLCLCGMMAADLMTLPESMREEINGFFADNERWLTVVIDSGMTAHQLTVQADPRVIAQLVLDTLEGGMLVSRCQGKVARFRTVIQQLFAVLGVAAVG